jgi:D-arginine dehydrogenase
MPKREQFDVVIVGGGIAGASLAYFLGQAGIGKVLILEREGQLAAHSTGRSAASISEYDENEVVLDLKILGSQFWRRPPEDFAEHPPLTSVGVLTLFDSLGLESLEARASELRSRGLEFELLTPGAVRTKVPALTFPDMGGALFAPQDGRLDVHGILQAYLRHARASGARLELGAEVLGLIHSGGRVSGVRLQDREVEAGLVINAAGAWASTVGQMAEAQPVQLQPKRRSLFTFAGPTDVDFANWPMVWSDPHEVYFVPEAGEMMLSPMDQVAMDPCDPRPDDETIAASLERLGDLAPSLVPRSIRSRWSGLRTFALDGAPVIGPDPDREGFFWLAGQGGAGIETSPAYGQIAADLIVSGRSTLFDIARLAPERFLTGNQAQALAMARDSG